MPAYKKKLYYTNLNKFIRDCVNVRRSAPVKFVDGYLDPHIIPTSGFKYKGVKEIRVGRLFLLGKVY
jgi:hypothetical protein